MVFCTHCGEKLSEDANFCAICGYRTKHGIDAGVAVPAEDWREAFQKAGLEVEKAFQIAGKEVQKAFKNIKDDVKEPKSSRNVRVCKSCGGKNPIDASFCTKCGAKNE